MAQSKEELIQILREMFPLNMNLTYNQQRAKKNIMDRYGIKEHEYKEVKQEA